ncbi:NAD(P)H-dependent oxidoreductase [Streptomyces sp. NPDC052036]|uniref:NADPH-dependent FMN reductase n=1 Tax=Streptomyces sp. NPDC052036 TaxID=3155171 RepID=UPI00341C7762
MQRPVNVLGIGGSTRPGSTAERALRATLAAAERLGATVTVIAGADLMMPLYDQAEAVSPAARRLLAALARADGVVIASPAYHGSTSGLLKNALDHIEELRTDERPYLSGRAVGCVTVAQGWQSGVSTLGALRTIVHALRGWPTPMGVVVNTSATGFTSDGRCADPRLQEQMETMARQVVEFARMYAGGDATPDDAEPAVLGGLVGPQTAR